MKIKSNTQIIKVFSGAYETIFDSRHIIEDIEYQNGSLSDEKIDELCQKWDESIIDAYYYNIDILENYINQTYDVNCRVMLDKQINSPKYYNGGNDTLSFDIFLSKKDYNKLLNLSEKREKEINEFEHEYLSNFLSSYSLLDYMFMMDSYQNKTEMIENIEYTFYDITREYFYNNCIV